MLETTKTAIFVGATQVMIDCLEQWRADGNGILAVVSDCPEVAAWASKTGTDLVAPKSNLAERFGDVDFEYLFSIVNHAVLPDDVITLPTRRAINYHDSLLPNYAGFNSTAWAILDGEASHGVTWHTMIADVDSGDIALQRTINISEEETAYSLGIKCAIACRESFAELITLLAEEVRSGAPMDMVSPGSQRNFHFRSERPGLGLIEFDQDLVGIDRLVRALEFGREDNWMCLPKLVIGDEVFLVERATAAVDTAATSPGQIAAISANSLSVSARDGVIRLSGLKRFDGTSVDPTTLGLKVGASLPSAKRVGDSLTELDAKLTKHERFWVRQLAQKSAPALAQIREHSDAAAIASVTRNRRYSASAYLAALAGYIARSGEKAEFDIALAKSLPQDADRFYATATPMRVAIDVTDSFAAACASIDAALALQDKHTTFARDVAARYPALKADETVHRALPVGVQLHGSPGLVPGSSLTLHVRDDAEDVTISYDEKAISKAAAEAMVARIETLLEDADARPDTPLAGLQLLPETERRQLLDLSQGPAKDYDRDACVHQKFEAQVARTPEATAAVYQSTSLTYRALDARANQVAQSLIENGVQPGDLVGVCLKRSTELVAALLGVMKAGAAYVPMDPSYPRDRLAIMLEDSGAKVLLTEAALATTHAVESVTLVTLESTRAASEAAVDVQVGSDALAYVIFTSGSTGRPKGVQVSHRNVLNFFCGMDDVIGTEPGVWLAVTSVSFDISVLEIFWTLARGFEVIIQGETDRSSLSGAPTVEVSDTPMDFGLFYFSSSQGDARPGETYKLLIEGAKYADQNGFQSVWTPERHFHEFGGIFPNPAVTTAALTTITETVALRAGSVVLPMHNPIRVAEDWSVLDQLSNGRVGLSFASGWHANDFALMPENYERRREIMVESIETVFKLWEGQEVEVANGEGDMIKVSTFPRPIQDRPPIWIASAGNIETFKSAGRLGANILTNMLGQDIEDLRTKLAAYREARAEAGFEGPGQVSLMLHTFVCDDTEKAREIAREPFCNYLQSSFDLVKVAPWMFPAFKRPSLEGGDAELDTSQFTDEDIAALMDHAFDRYFETAGLFGSPEHALALVEQLKDIGVNELACLVDFGIESNTVLENLPHLTRLRELANSGGEADTIADEVMTVGDTFKAHDITHLQCTPSMARMLIDDPDVLDQFGSLKHLMLGGEALPTDLADTLTAKLTGQFTNMYGPTETTIWSTTSPVKAGAPITIGRPIANTTIRLLDAHNNLVGLGEAGELCIGGEGVVPGYFGRDDLTAERFIDDPFAPGERLYRTGDLARYKASGEIEYLGRMDQQVKVNGYRIELGEIETELTRHPDIWQSVVSSDMDNGAARLVAYYTSPQSVGEDSDVVDRWKTLWDTAYQQSEDDVDVRFNFAGWNDSYTGAPIPAEHMREWRDATQRNILDLAPQRVLEIGCGTGMVLYSLLNDVEHYTGTDISRSAIDAIEAELSADEQAKVALYQRPAHEIEKFEPGSFDTVVINSVAQYFPNADYLVQVLKTASTLVADGGQIFVGDVRSLEQLAAFHTVIELTQASAQLDNAALKSRIQKRIDRDSELVLGSDFFHALVRDVPRLQGAKISLKRGQMANEMTDFRYDVVLSVGDRADAPLALPAPAQVDALDQLQTLMAAGEPVVFAQGLQNARVAPIYAARAALNDDRADSVSALREMMEQDREVGIDPQALFDLHPDYALVSAQIDRQDPSRFDAVFLHSSVCGKTVASALDASQLNTPASYANQPAAQAEGDHQITAQLQAHLRERLPEYMIPSVFVAMDSFPLTPNGKIDRKALPAPSRREAPVETEFVPPSNELEITIANVWKDLLGLEQVGRTDNIFDIGANSLMTAQANQRLSKQLGRRVSLVSMFRYPTVETLAANLGDDSSKRDASPAKVEKMANRREAAAARRRAMREQLT